MLNVDRKKCEYIFLLFKHNNNNKKFQYFSIQFWLLHTDSYDGGGGS